MAITRGTTGITAPRKPYTPATSEPATKTTKPKTKTKTAAKPKANTSKPRAKATAAGRVEKKEPATKKKGKPTVGEKVKGAVEKAAGAIEKKPAKKVCRPSLLLAVCFIVDVAATGVVWDAVLFDLFVLIRIKANAEARYPGCRHQEDEGD